MITLEELESLKEDMIDETDPKLKKKMQIDLMNKISDYVIQETNNNK